jgi:hypothetical protein
MIWTFRDPVTGETVRSDIPPSQYRPRDQARKPRSTRNSSPHRQTTRNGAALSTLDNTDNDD